MPVKHCLSVLSVFLLSLLACQPLSIIPEEVKDVTRPDAEVTPAHLPSASPPDTASPMPPLPHPDVQPSSVPIPETSSPQGVPTSAPTPTPSALPTRDPSATETLPLVGATFDEAGQPVSQAKIHVKGNGFSFEVETQSNEKGKYLIRVPTSKQLLITASKPGYITRNTIYVYPENGQIGFALDFGKGVNGSTFAFNNQAEIAAPLTQKPEVQFVDYLTTESSLKLTFALPMKPSSVEEALNITPLEENNQSTLTPQNTFTALNFTWNQDNTEVTIQPKNSHFPQTNQPLHFNITFNKPIESQAGFKRDAGFFKIIKRENNPYLIDTSPFQDSYTFSIPADTIPPELLSATSTDASINLKFSEPMSVLNVTAKDYTLNLLPGANSTTLPFTGTWAALGGQAASRLTDKTIIELRFPHNQSPTTLNSFIGLGQSAFTTPTTQPIQYQPSEQTNVWNFGWKLVKPDGTTTEQFLSDNLLTESIANASVLALKLQTALNQTSFTTGLTLATSPNPWVITTHEDNKSLKIQFKDTTYRYVGWQLVGGTYTITQTGTLPPGTLTHEKSIAPNRPFPLFHPGDTLEITLISTMGDPAGNPINPEKLKTVVLVP